MERARLYDLPDAPPPIGVAASGSSSVKLAASHGDALIAVQPDGGLVRARARELWRWAVPGWHVMAELPDLRAFDAASGTVREEDVTALVPCGPDAGSYVKAAREWAGSQQDFIARAAAELLPALRALLESRTLS